MIVGMLSLIVTTIVQWTLQPTSASDTVIDIVNAHAGLWAVTSVLSVLGPLLWVAGIGAITSVVRDRGWVLTTVGGSITALGLIAGVGHLALFFGLSSDLAASGAPERPPAPMRSTSSPGVRRLLRSMVVLVATMPSSSVSRTMPTISLSWPSVRSGAILRRMGLGWV